MNRLISLLVILSIIYYFYYKERKVITEYKNLLKPKISRELEKDKYNDITKFLFKIQMFYYYNPEAYIEMSKHIDDFVLLYKSVEIDNRLSGKFYDLMTDKKSLILNNLRSIQIKLPLEYNAKDSLIDLEEILNKYLDIVYYYNQKDIYENGINFKKKIINKKEMAYNRYQDDIAQFAYY